MYDIDSGDTVEVNADKVIVRVTAKSGYVGFRFLQSASADRVSEIASGLMKGGCKVEFATDSSVIAVSAPDEISQRVADLLAALEENGELQYETIRSVDPKVVPFDVFTPKSG